MTDTAVNPYRSRRQLAHRVLLTGYLGLLLLFTVSNSVLDGGSLTLWLVQSLPLLIFAPGLWRQLSATYLWLCCVLLMYFIWAVTAVMSPLAQWHHYLALLLILILCTSAMLASHWTHKGRKLANTTSTS